MKGRSALRLGLGGFSGIVTAWLAAASACASEGYALSRGQYWLTAWAARPIFSLVGDVDGDGRADLIAFDPRGDASLWVHRTSILGKPTPQVSARERFGREGLAAIAGRFTRGAGEDVLAVFADGSVRIASGTRRGGAVYARDDLAATIAPGMRQRPSIRLVAGEFDGDGRIDAIVVDDSGRLLLLRNETAEASSPHFRCEEVDGALPPKVPQVAAGRFAAGGRAELVWKDGANSICRAGLNFSTGQRPGLGPVTRLLTAAPADRLAVGRFRGGEACDLIVGRRLLPGGDASRAFDVATLPTPEEASGDRHWIVGDFDGNGRDDLLRQRESGPPFVGWVAPEPPWWSSHYRRWTDPFLAHDTVIHFSSLEGDQRKGYIASAGDGLLDDWKTGSVRPGGLDLKALGCRVGRRDLIVEVERFDSVNFDLLKAGVSITTRRFAQAHVANPDGSRGIALHVIYREPTPHEQFDLVAKTLYEQYPPRAHRGVVHTMFCGPFGAALMMSDKGGFGTSTEVHDMMSHELGHELGLNHDGYQTHNSPIYPSLMSYTYQNITDGHDSRYSDGSLRSLLLNERKLSERLPVPFDRVRFLANDPYYYPLRAAGSSTLVDWNRNGIFGEAGVLADINYSHFTDIGRRRYEVGSSESGPALATVGDGPAQRLLLFSGRARGNLPRPAPDAPASAASLGPERPGAIVVRVWLGDDRDRDGERWSAETLVEANGVIGDPAAVSGRNAIWVAYATTAGARVRRVTLGRQADATPRVGEAVPIEQSNGAEPSLSAVGDGLALFLWRGPGRPVGVRRLAPTIAGLETGPELELPIDSVAPVAAAAGPNRGGRPTVWVASIGGPEPRQPRVTVHHYVSEGGGRARFLEIGRNLVDGSFARRPMTLLWRPEHGLDATGRIYLFAGGQYFLQPCRIQAVDTPWAEQTVSINVRNGPVDGWLHRRYYAPGDFDSRSAPGACWFRDDIAYANRLHSPQPDRNDRLLLGFTATGAYDTMTDFDDYAFIAEIGLCHSLSMVSE